MTAPNTLTTLSPGTVFADDFKIVKPLRAGGMGAVYVVEQLSTGKQRALKLMIPELVDNPEIRERFEREAKASGGIDSDHVVETVTAGVDVTSGSPYIVMELLRGEELADAAERSGPLPLGDVAVIMTQIGHALEQAHKMGIVHRDLKPENIFLCSSRRGDDSFTAKVLDFGIAKLVADGIQKTGTRPLGSPLYMSPEQTDRKGRICPATDVWALGLIAFYLLTGKSYWLEATDGSLPTLLREIVIEPLSPASERAAELGVADKLPAGFDAWFAKCVVRDIDARFQEAGAACRAFGELVPAGPATRKLNIQTRAISHAPPKMDTLAKGATELLDATRPAKGAAPITSIASGTGQAGVVVRGATDGAMTAAEVKPKSSVPFVIAATLAVLVGGAVAVVTMRTPAPISSASSAVGVAVSALPLPSASAAAVSPVALADDPRCPTGMIYHPGGTTILGAKDIAGDDAKVTHTVTVSPYCLERTEVTVAQYETCVEAGKCERTPNDVRYDGVTDETKRVYTPLCNARKPDRKDHPINCVDWKMAVDYCGFRSGRLPTEAEWEAAARGKGQRDYPWGDEAPGPTHLNAAGSEYKTWHDENRKTTDTPTMFEGSDGFAGTAPVGSFKAGASELGVLDLAGNVWEWTADWYGPYPTAATTDPIGPASGTHRVVRGGAFNGSMIDWAKPAYRWKSVPDTYNHGIGFRCASAPQ